MCQAPWIAWWNSEADGTQVYFARDSEGDGSSPVILVAASVFGAAFDDPTRSEGPKTEEGIGVGSTLEELTAAYPDSVQVEGFHGVVYQQVGTMFFGHRDGSPITEVVVTAGMPPLELCG